MRILLTGLFAVLGWTGVARGIDEPERTPETPDAERIAQLIRELGSDDYTTREQATKQLVRIGLAAKASLDVAKESEDVEARQRAIRVLQSLDRLVAQEAFLAATQGPWQEALKEGRWAGPLLGAAGMNRPPLPVDLSAFAAEGPAGTVDHSLCFLARTQGLDGSWPTRFFGAEIHADAEQTALALLALLGAGHTEKVGRWKGNVRSATAYLRKLQRKDGAILNENWTHVDNLTHALVTMALSEASGMANVNETKVAAQRAIDFVVKQQDARSGGFGRGPGIVPDLLTTTMHILALKSAKVAGLSIPPTVFEGAIRFLDSVEDKDRKTYRYVADGKSSARAAVLGALARQMLGWKKEDLAEIVTAAFKELGGPALDREDSDMLINYFGTLVAFHQGGEIWKDWNEAMKKSYLPEQAKEGPAAGAWAPKGAWGGGGYILSTALGGLQFCVYYRYLPGQK